MLYSEVVGQESIKQHLSKQLAAGRVPHACLFSGAPGSGKLPMALAFATALLCESPNEGAPCGQCHSCRQNALFAHPDMHYVFPVYRYKSLGSGEEPSADHFLPEWRAQLADTPYFDRQTWRERIGVENQQTIIYKRASDEIASRLSLAAAQGGRKVVLVWMAELMNETAANKLLKILEEPPRDTVFILVTEQPERLLPTTRSRTQPFLFRPLADDQIAQTLERRQGLDPETARQIAHNAQGSYTAALAKLHVDAQTEASFDLFARLMRLAYARDIKGMRAWADELAACGRERQKDFLQYSQRLIRENFVYNYRLPDLNYLDAREARFAARFARFVHRGNVSEIMEELSNAQRDIAGNAYAPLVFFDLALKMIVLILKQP